AKILHQQNAVVLGSVVFLRREMGVALDDEDSAMAVHRQSRWRAHVGGFRDDFKQQSVVVDPRHFVSEQKQRSCQSGDIHGMISPGDDSIRSRRPLHERWKTLDDGGTGGGAGGNSLLAAG